MGTQAVTSAAGSAKRVPWRLHITFWLDLALLVSVCVLQSVRFTGLVVHEWLGLGVVVMIFAHLLLAWSWIASQTRRFFTSQSIRERTNYLLNLAFFATAVAAVYSGILISQKAIPLLTASKAKPEMNWRWDRLHNEFAQIVLVLAGLHLAINWDWVLAAVQKIAGRLLKGEQ